jgi:hypothetical protein
LDALPMYLNVWDDENLPGAQREQRISARLNFLAKMNKISALEQEKLTKENHPKLYSSGPILDWPRIRKIFALAIKYQTFCRLRGRPFLNDTLNLRLVNGNYMIDNIYDQNRFQGR